MSHIESRDNVLFYSNDMVQSAKVAAVGMDHIDVIWCEGNLKFAKRLSKNEVTKVDCFWDMFRKKFFQQSTY